MSWHWSDGVKQPVSGEIGFRAEGRTHVKILSRGHHGISENREGANEAGAQWGLGTVGGEGTRRPGHRPGGQVRKDVFWVGREGQGSIEQKERPRLLTGMSGRSYQPGDMRKRVSEWPRARGCVLKGHNLVCTIISFIGYYNALMWEQFASVIWNKHPLWAMCVHKGRSRTQGGHMRASVRPQNPGQTSHRRGTNHWTKGCLLWGWGWGAACMGGGVDHWLNRSNSSFPASSHSKFYSRATPYSHHCFVKSSNYLWLRKRADLGSQRWCKFPKCSLSSPSPAQPCTMRTSCPHRAGANNCHPMSSLPPTWQRKGPRGQNGQQPLPAWLAQIPSWLQGPRGHTFLFHLTLGSVLNSVSPYSS